jgi:nucleotide-binding universal stress UspA family protein
MSSADPIDQCAAATPEGPLLVCYDASGDAKYAIKEAGRLLAARPALVVTVWQPIAALSSFGWSGATTRMVNLVELDCAAIADGGRVADEGVAVARAAGLEAEPVAIKASGPVWKTIIEIADSHDAAAIVMGSRALTGVRSMLLGSVSGAVGASRQPAHTRHPSPQRRLR